MLLLLTYFHMYWMLSVLRTYTPNTWENDQNMQPRKAQRSQEKAHPHDKLGPDTDMEATQAQPEAHQSKAVASGAA